ncbi:MAG: ribonuclease P protein component [Anaerolineaceae bacterium]|nr:ribonuclease P protein component [Anaerolineaceae bacterium]
MERRFRLRHSKDFTRLRQHGTATQNRYLLMSRMPNGLSHNRYGLVTSGRVGGAVVRNRTRRLLREVIRGLNPRLRSGFDVVLIVRQPLTQQPFKIVNRILTEMFDQANLMLVESSEG